MHKNYNKTSVYKNILIFIRICTQYVMLHLKIVPNHPESFCQNYYCDASFIALLTKHLNQFFALSQALRNKCNRGNDCLCWEAVSGTQHSTAQHTGVFMCSVLCTFNVFCRDWRPQHNGTRYKDKLKTEWTHQVMHMYVSMCVCVWAANCSRIDFGTVTSWFESIIRPN